MMSLWNFFQKNKIFDFIPQVFMDCFQFYWNPICYHICVKTVVPMMTQSTNSFISDTSSFCVPIPPCGRGPNWGVTPPPHTHTNDFLCVYLVLNYSEIFPNQTPTMILIQRVKVYPYLIFSHLFVLLMILQQPNLENIKSSTQESIFFCICLIVV